MNKDVKIIPASEEAKKKMSEVSKILEGQELFKEKKEHARQTLKGLDKLPL